MRDVRAGVALALAVIAALVTFAATLALYTSHFLVDGDGFADKVAETVRPPAVSTEPSVRLAGALETAVPNAVVARRPLQDTAASLISSGAFDPIVRRAALVLHGALFTQNAENVSLDLADGLQLLNSFVSAQQPALRGQVAPAARARVVSLRNQGPIRVVSSSGRLIGVLAWSLTLLALLLFAASVAVARNRGRALGRVGFCVAAAGVGVFIAESVAVKVRIEGFAQTDAVDAALKVFLGGLAEVAVVLVLAGGCWPPWAPAGCPAAWASECSSAPGRSCAARRRRRGRGSPGRSCCSPSGWR